MSNTTELQMIRLPLRAMEDGYSQRQIQRLIALARQLPHMPQGLSKSARAAWTASPEGKSWLQENRKLFRSDKLKDLYAEFGEEPEEKIAKAQHPAPMRETLEGWEQYFKEAGAPWPNGWRDIRALLGWPTNTNRRRIVEQETIVQTIDHLLYNGVHDDAGSDPPADGDDLTPEEAAIVAAAAAGLRARRAASSPTPAPPGGTPTPEEGTTMRTIDEINAEADQLLANFTPPGVDPYIWDPSQWDRSREHEGKLGWVGLITRQPFYVPAQWVQERLTADKSMWVDDPEVETHLKDLIREALRHQLPADVSDDELSAQMTHNFYEIAYKGSRSFAEIKPDRPLTGGRVDVDELAATAQARLSGQQPSAKPKAAKPPKAKRPKRDGRGKPKPPAPPTPVTIGSGGLDPDIAALRSVAEKAIERLRSI